MTNQNKLYVAIALLVVFSAGYFVYSKVQISKMHESCITENTSRKKHENLNRNIEEACYDFHYASSERDKNAAVCRLDAFLKAERDNPVTATGNINRACEIMQVVKSENEKKILNCIIDKTLIFRMGEKYRNLYDQCKKENS